jgi:hypothetical protein
MESKDLLVRPLPSREEDDLANAGGVHAGDDLLKVLALRTMGLGVKEPRFLGPLGPRNREEDP